MERMSGASLEGWRLRHGPRLPRERALRIVIVGDGPVALETARRLADGGIAEVVLSAGSRAQAEHGVLDLGGAVRPVVRLQAAAPADALVVCSDDPARAREAALWAAKSCPLTALIFAARDGLALSREAARASGLAPWLILSAGGIPRAAAAARRIAKRLQVSASQICVPVIGADGPGRTRTLERYTTVAGIAASELGDRAPREWPREAEDPITEGALACAAVALARAVIEDRRQVLSCGAWVEGAFGIPGAFVTAPVPVGARGAEEPLPLCLTLEERAFLQKAAGAEPR